MSYILEALKKSDQKRKLGNVPDLHANHTDKKGGGRKQGRRLGMFFFLGGLVLVNVFLWLFFGGPGRDGDEPIIAGNIDAVSDIVVNRQVAAEVQPPVIVDELPEEPIDVPVAAKPLIVEPKILLESVPEVVEELETETSSLLPKMTADDPVAVIPESVLEPSPAAPEVEVMLQKDLPDQVRDRLPEMSISLHFFSNKPSSRLVRINDKHLGEGDYVQDDLRLIEITRDGVVLEFEGYHFLVGK